MSVMPGWVATESSEANHELGDRQDAKMISMDVPARVLAYFAACENPLEYTGRVLLRRARAGRARPRNRRLREGTHRCCEPALGGRHRPAARRPGRRPGERLTVVTGFPGGGCNRRYHDLDSPGRQGYSEARYHLARGQVFVACDHLGTGDSDTPARPLDYNAVARANMQAGREILRMLSDGDVAADVPPVNVAAAAALEPRRSSRRWRICTTSLRAAASCGA